MTVDSEARRDAKKAILRLEIILFSLGSIIFQFCFPVKLYEIFSSIPDFAIRMKKEQVEIKN